MQALNQLENDSEFRVLNLILDGMFFSQQWMIHKSKEKQHVEETWLWLKWKTPLFHFQTLILPAGGLF